MSFPLSQFDLYKLFYVILRYFKTIPVIYIIVSVLLYPSKLIWVLRGLLALITGYPVLRAHLTSYFPPLAALEASESEVLGQLGALLHLGHVLLLDSAGDHERERDKEGGGRVEPFVELLAGGPQLLLSRRLPEALPLHLGPRDLSRERRLQPVHHVSPVLPPHGAGQRLRVPRRVVPGAALRLGAQRSPRAPPEAAAGAQRRSAPHGGLLGPLGPRRPLPAARSGLILELRHRHLRPLAAGQWG